MVLDSLRIQNFKTFRDLTVERLGRVNLVVGKNNVGKTALLEALWLYAHPEFFYDLLEHLDDQRSSNLTKSRAIQDNFRVIRSYFHGWPSLEGDVFPSNYGVEASVGSVDGYPHCISMRVVMGDPLLSDNRVTGSDLDMAAPNLFVGWNELRTMQNIPHGVQLYSPRPPFFSSRVRDYEVLCLYVPSSNLFAEDTEQLFADAIRANRKAPVMRALNLTTEETITDLNWIVDPNLAYRLSGDRVQVDPTHQMDRIPVVAVEGRGEAVPLSALGEGTTRAMEIALALVNAKGGLLLIDEVETGLHYSVQPDLWRLIFETAAALDVQVVATTHSSDCVRAFQRMASAHDEEGVLISLRRRRSDPSEVVAVTIGEDSLETALDAHIDVR